MARIWVLFMLLAVIAGAAFAEEPAPRWSASLNPVKAVMGLINFEIEYAFLPRFSTSLAAEYLVTDRALSRSEHPDLVVRLEPRYYFLGGGFGWGPFAGAHLGYSHSSSLQPADELFVGVAAGYRAAISGRFFVAPRGLLSYAIGQARIVPGFELVAGILF